MTDELIALKSRREKIAADLAKAAAADDETRVVELQSALYDVDLTIGAINDRETENKKDVLQDAFDFEVDKDGARLTCDDTAITAACNTADEVDYSVGRVKKQLNVVARKMKEAVDEREASGPATDVLDKMHADIEGDRSSRKRKS